jgi:CO dehydrogenase/acetyl-CoA synthase epsilon subunit
MAEVAKIYTEEQKYNGVNGSFNHKLVIFLDIYKRVELPEDALLYAFPTMLKGLALDRYYNALLS